MTTANVEHGPEPVQGDELICLQAIWRHGQRAPIGTFEGDLYPESHWRKGYGELTEKGLQQHYELGKWIKARYIDHLHYLPKQYDPKTVFLRCSVVPRTIESASENFKGLYEHDPNFVQPEVNTFKDKDCVCLPFRCCAKSREEILKCGNGEPMKMYLARYGPILEKLAKATGRRFTTFVDALFLTDPFTTEKHHGLELPKEFDDVFDEIDMAHRDSLRNLYGYIGHTEESSLVIRKAMGSGLLEQVLKNIDERITNSPEAKATKYFVFSAHDTVVLALLATFEFDKLDYNQNFNVSLGASVFIELWKKPNGDYYIKVLYRRNADEVYDLTGEIKDCSQYKEGIPLEFFRQRWDKFLQQHGPECQHVDSHISAQCWEESLKN